MDAAGVCHAFTTVALPPLRVTGAAPSSPSATAPGCGLCVQERPEIRERTVCALGLLRTANPVRPDGVHKRC